MPLYKIFLGEGFPTRIDYRKKGTLILTSLLEDLVVCLTPCFEGTQGLPPLAGYLWQLRSTGFRGFSSEFDLVAPSHPVP